MGVYPEIDLITEDRLSGAIADILDNGLNPDNPCIYEMFAYIGRGNARVSLR